MSTRRFHIGCAIWAYKDWVGELFPLGSKSADFLAEQWACANGRAASSRGYGRGLVI